MSSEYQIAFWNLENLFDVENSPRRNDKLERAIGNDLQGWTQALLDRKIDQLVSIITQMNNGAGPEILGVCEIENEYVMGLLAQDLNTALGRNYAIVHHNTQDRRGIDVGFIYDASLFSVEMQFNHFVMRRTATRDILQVNFMTQSNRRFVLIGNHWPARTSGTLETSGYRSIAGETLAYFHHRILESHGNDTPVLAMGDFNDEPFDRSLVDYALSTRSRTKVLNAKIARLLNLMWPCMGQGFTSYYYNNFPNFFDQFLANKNLLKNNMPIVVDLTSVEVISLPEMVASGDYPIPIRFGGMGKTVNQDGFSDHFPVTVKVLEVP